MILKSVQKALNPTFLQGIDQDYLLNYPRLWTLKIHYLCYYVGIINLFVLICILLYRCNFYHASIITNLALVLCGLHILFAIIWITLQFYYNISYNSKKQFGKINIKQEWLFDIVGYLVCLLILASPVIIFSTAMQYKMIGKSSVDQVIADFAIFDILDHNNEISSSPFFSKAEVNSCYGKTLEEDSTETCKEENKLFKNLKNNILEYYKILKKTADLLYNESYNLSDLEELLEPYKQDSQPNYDKIPNWLTPHKRARDMLNNMVKEKNDYYYNLLNTSHEKIIFCDNTNNSKEDCRNILVIINRSYNTINLLEKRNRDLRESKKLFVEYMINKYLKDKDLLELLINQNYSFFYKLISQYSGQEIDESKAGDMYFVPAKENCEQYYNFITYDLKFASLLVLCIFIHLILLLVITKYIELRLLIVAIIFLAIFIVLVLPCYFLIASVVSFSDLRDYYYLFLSWLFAFIIIIISITNHKYKTIKNIILAVILPFAIASLGITLVEFIFDDINQFESDNSILKGKIDMIFLLFSSLLYLPFLPLLTQRFKNQLSLPKEK
ncbi:MAG: hypothetical protein AB4062_20670 [Crocosphaera sp.]